MDFFAIALSVVVGHFLARATVGILRRLLGLGSTAKGEKLLVALIGVSERAIVTALMIHQADIVPWFIGAWVLLKFAGGWKRFTDPSRRNRAIYQVAILGNVVSIGWAIAVGDCYSPDPTLEFCKSK